MYIHMYIYIIYIYMELRGVWFIARSGKIEGLVWCMITDHLSVVKLGEATINQAVGKGHLRFMEDI